MKVRRVARTAVHLAAPVVLIGSGLTIAFYITAEVYRRVGWHPAALEAQIINTVLGLMLMVLAVIVFGLLFRKPRGGPFANIIDALERIAKGDFSTRLDARSEARGAVAELVQSVNRMALQLDQMEKMRREFVSDVSHEIQSPLTSIRGFACALRENHLTDEERRHYLDVIDSESVRLSNLSANLLKLASLESAQPKFEPRDYRLDAQIRRLILACEPQWAGKQLEMDVALEEADIKADEDLLSQVWINLIHNGIKFTPPGGSLRVALRRLSGRLEVTIADTGIGIPAQDLPHIFERFYKADRSRRRTESGSGLGLSIAKKVVEMHRGTIAVESQSGSGSVFTVNLPLA
ncbi:MAG TPA: ATP-binding protein [Bryobacteraceae bacterium]|nr:ATP-binding protein [Bryobacteraceae bacterium]